MSLVKRNSDWFAPASIDSFFDRFLNEGFTPSKSAFVPRTDIAETEKGFEIQLAVPGMSKEDFKVDLKEGRLTVSGERKFNNEQKDRNYYAVQTEYGSFRKSFQLPDNINEKKIDASYENGILSLMIPKDKTKKVESAILVK